MSNSCLIQAVLHTYRFHHQFLPGLLDAMDDEAMRETFGRMGRCAHWLLGHIAASRRFMGRQAGLEIPALAWEEFFSPESNPTFNDAWPDREELLKDFDSTGMQILDALQDFPPEQFEKQVPGLFNPETSEPLVNQISFLLTHESYHMGQVGYIRSLLGLEYLA